MRAHQSHEAGVLAEELDLRHVVAQVANWGDAERRVSLIHATYQG